MIHAASGAEALPHQTDPAGLRGRAFHSALWLGEPSPGALRLPDARASRTAMYGPRAVCLHRRSLIACDSGNHRVLIWKTLPNRDHAPADIVLGQSDWSNEAPGLLHLPTSAIVVDDRLLVADAWHHRVLIWNHVPTACNQPPDSVLGQESTAGTLPNRGACTSRTGLYWPYGLHAEGNRLFVADTGNRRVLIWNSIPTGDTPPDHVIGQPHFEMGEENRGEGVGPRSFRWPHSIATPGGALLIADAGNHRLLAWRSVAAACAGEPADAAIGQPNMTTAREWPYGPQGPSGLRFPYSIATADRTVFVSDTANNRVLMFDVDRLFDRAPAAHAVLAQPDFASSGENQWAAVRADTLCWPYGLAVADDTLAIADSGNNRVTIWRRGIDREDR